ncbi:cytochrome P450, partial [Actinosynnema sp. NPDC023658]|uniref:cytochrome P450 n=1 Tax=Actinosynnema sp. NPDC023658 TaxID=3155465 RepID=UPI00340142C9
MADTDREPRDLDGLFDWLGRMRTSEPVSFDPDRGVWNVFRYQDAVAVLSDHATFSSDVTGLLRKTLTDDRDFDAFVEGNMLVMDPPDHKKLRKLVNKGFTPRMVAQLEPRVRRIVDELFAGLRGSTAVDLVSDIAYPLPVTVIAQMLGVPVSDHPLFHKWSEELTSNADGATGVRQAEIMRSIARTVGEMKAYVQEHLLRRREDPGDDLISALAHAEVDGERLTDVEISGLVALMLRAGHITTTLLMSNAVALLDTLPEVTARLRDDPAAIPGAMEEILRYRPVVTSVLRLTSRETVLQGRTLPAGQLVTVWLASANRDAAQFTAPDSFDPDRRPNQHLSFAHGAHFCIGAPLARLEVRVVLETILARWAELAVAPGADYYDPIHILGAKRQAREVRW